MRRHSLGRGTEPHGRRTTRLGARLHLILRAARHSGAHFFFRRFSRFFSSSRVPSPPRRILIAHRLLLGDTMMLAPLFAALRARYGDARIDTTVAPEYLPLFDGHPYGVRAFAYDPRRHETVSALCREADRGGGYDLALIPGDNRYALLARALGARRIVALADEESRGRRWKNFFCDEFVPWPQTPMTLAEIFTLLAEPPSLAKNGASPVVSPSIYRRGDWPAPQCVPLAPPPPSAPYAVLHLGASSPLRYWDEARWRELAAWLAEDGITPVWSAGPKEGELIARVDREGRYPAYAGNLDLAQLWHLIAGASLVVCPDTGIAHLAKLVATPTVCLFGPGAPSLLGKGNFWCDIPFVGVGPDEFPCRDQNLLFKRTVSWVRRCQRTMRECPRARCMESIEVATVVAAAEKLLKAISIIK